MVWLENFLTNLEVVLGIDKPITLYCDNSGVVANSKELCSHKRGKYIKRKYHLIQKIVNEGDITVTKIPIFNNLADLFTKTLTEKQFFKHVERMGLRDMSHLF